MDQHDVVVDVSLGMPRLILNFTRNPDRRFLPAKIGIVTSVALGFFLQLCRYPINTFFAITANDIADHARDRMAVTVLARSKPAHSLANIEPCQIVFVASNTLAFNRQINFFIPVLIRNENVDQSQLSSVIHHVGLGLTLKLHPWFGLHSPFNRYHLLPKQICNFVLIGRRRNTCVGNHNRPRRMQNLQSFLQESPLDAKSQVGIRVPLRWLIQAATLLARTFWQARCLHRLEHALATRIVVGYV